MPGCNDSTKFFLLLLFSIIANSLATNKLNAQMLEGQPLIDSLSQELSKAKTDTGKVKILYQLATISAPYDSVKALNYANQCKRISNQANWAKGLGLSYISFARVYLEISNFTNGIQNCDTAYAIFKKLNDKEFMGRTLLLSGSAYTQLGYYAKGIENNFAALQLFEYINKKSWISRCYNNLGGAYYFLSDYSKAVDNYKKALAIYNEVGDKYGIASATDNIATTFFEKGNYDSANVYNLRSTEIFKELNNQPALARIYNNRGNLLEKLYDVKSAYDYFMRAAEINNRFDIKQELGNNYYSIGKLYLDIAADSSGKYILPAAFKTGNKALLKKARYYFDKTLAVGKGVGAISLMMDCTNLASETEDSLGNYKAALAFHRQYMLYKDSIFNDENKKKIAALETRRLTEVKDKEIQILNQQKALQTSEVKRQTLIRNIIIGAVTVAGAVLFLFTWSFNRRRKTAFDKQVKEVEMKALRAQMNPHFIFNSLQSINQYVIQNDKENASAYLSKFANLMRMVLENSREQEVPLEKDLNALELYMQLESLRFKNRFTYIIETGPGIDKENTLIPPLLLQPFVENAIIHGVHNTERGLIKISVNKESDMIRCVVEDNGIGRKDPIGFVPQKNNKRRSLGLTIISERLNIINQFKKVKTAVNIFDLKDAENKPGGLRIELLLPFEPAF